MSKSLSLLGYASGIAANDPGCAEGPIQLRQQALETQLSEQGLLSRWQTMLMPREDSKIDCLQQVAELNNELAHITYQLTQQKQHFAVLGGDHSSALGTWSGVATALSQQQGSLGLIWIDAHMDSHTFDTTHTGNIHGMPLAALMGYGDDALTKILMTHAKLDPKQLSLIGTRSYEPEEAALLERLGVRIYDMQEIEQRGLNIVLAEAISHAKKNSLGIGISLDLDAIDPMDAPGVGVPVAHGLIAESLCQSLTLLQQEEKLIGIEIVEYNPYRDKNHKTEKLIQQLLLSIFGVTGYE